MKVYPYRRCYKSYGHLGSGGGNSGGVVAVAPDGAPTELLLSVPSDTSISGTFTIGSTNQDGHYAYYSIDNVNFTRAENADAVMTGADNSFTITGLTAGTFYYVKVCAYKGALLSSYSNTAVDITTLNTILSNADKVGWYIPAYDNITKDVNYGISQLNDLSGAGNHLTEASYLPFFNTKAVAFALDGTRTQLIKTGMTLNQPVVHFMVIRTHALRGTGQTCTYIDGTDATHRGMVAYAYDTDAVNWILNAGSTVSTGVPILTGKPEIIRVILSGANSRLKRFATDSGDKNAGTQNPGAIRLGNNYTAGTSTQAQFSLYEYAVRINTNNENDIYNYLYNKYFANRTWNVNWNGHSMLNSLEVGTDIALPDHTESWLKKDHSILIYPPFNSSLGGATIATISSRKATYVTPYYDSTAGVKNIVVVMLGTNDVTSTPGTGATAYTALQTYVYWLISNWWTPVIVTMIKATTDAQRDTERGVYNTAIKANKNFEYVLDTDTIPELADPEDTDYFNADTIHLVNAGNYILGRYLASKMAEIDAVRPFAYETELQYYITGLATPLSSGFLSKLNTFILALKSGLNIPKLFTAFDTLYVLAGETSESALKNLAQNAYHGTLSGASHPTFEQYKGFTGTGSGYIETGYIPSSNGVAYVQNSASLGVYSFTNKAEDSVDMGCMVSLRSHILIRTSTNLVIGRVNTGGQTSDACTNSNNLFICTRTASTTEYTYQGTTKGAILNTASSAPPAVSHTILARNNNGTIDSYSTRQLGLAFAGKGLSDADVAVIYNAWIAFIS